MVASFLYNSPVVRMLSHYPGHLPFIYFLHVSGKTHVSYPLDEFSCPSSLSHVLNCFVVEVLLCLPVETVLLCMVR